MIYDHIVCFLEWCFWNQSRPAVFLALCVRIHVKLGREFDTAVDQVIGGERLLKFKCHIIRASDLYYHSRMNVMSVKRVSPGAAVEGLNTRRFSCIFTVICEWQSQTLWPWSPSTVFPVQPFLMYGTVREFLECLAFSLFKMFLFPPKKEQPLYRICNANGGVVLWWYLKQTVTFTSVLFLMAAFGLSLLCFSMSGLIFKSAAHR